ncbi:MAG: ADOP family duplicated permease, partial [Vicinamibacterales bacterium]
MSLFHAIRRGLRNLVSRTTFERELDDELRDYLERATAEHLRAGASLPEAVRAARREIGSLEAAKEEVRSGLWEASVHACWRDVIYGARMLARHPGVTTVVVLTLGLGIGGTSAIFSLVDAVLLQTLPVDRPEQLVLIEQGMVRGGTQNMSRPLFEWLRDERRVFSGIFAAQDGRDTVTVGGVASDSVSPPAGVSSGDAAGTPSAASDRPESASVQAVSGEYFDVLNTSALLGRTLTPEDDRTPGAHPVAVLSHRFWTRRFAADPGIIGRTITLARQPFTIVGVTRPGFFGEAVGRAPEIWVPMMMHPTLNPGLSLLGEPNVGWLQVMGRLQPGVTREQAGAALALVLDRLKADPAALGGMPRHIGRLEVSDGSQGLTRLREQFSLPLRILAAVVGVVLLIACANVSTLLLARASTRQREIAIRLAIGAGRGRLVRQLMTESLLLATIGGSLGLLLSWWGSQVLLVLLSGDGPSVAIEVTPDARLLGFTALVSIGAVILFGLAPALSASRAHVNTELKQTPGVRSRIRLSPILVVTQVALSLLLITGAALFLQTLHNLRTRDLGFAAETLLQVRTQPEASGYTREQIPAVARRVVERLRAMPGVRAVSVAHSGFATGTSRTCCIAIPGRVFESDREREVRMIGVGPGYFETVGQRLRLGRDFAPHDASTDSLNPKAAIVNEAFVRQFLGEGNPLGKHFGWGNPPNVQHGIEVIGVVNDAIYDDVRDASKPLIYFPSEAGRMYVVRAAGVPGSLMGSVRRQIQAGEPKLIVTSVTPIVQDVERALVREKLLARLSGFFGALAAGLAGIGLYGLMAYAVTNRTRDIGIRMALGAPRGRVLRTEIWSALRLVAIGIVIGIPAALAAGRLIAAQLFGVSATDP